MVLNAGDKITFQAQHLSQLLEALTTKGYRVIGPTLRQQAIVYDQITTIADLPAGWTDEQAGGSYRLKKSGNEAYFNFNISPHTWKKFLSPPEVRLWAATQSASGFSLEQSEEAQPKLAFLGVHPCELQALAILDRVFMQDQFVDPVYQSRREGLFIVALNCTQAGETCFCLSMQTGPQARAGFDLALTEIVTDNEHYFVMEVGSASGAEVASGLDYLPASPAQLEAADNAVQQAAQHMGRQLDTDGLKELLYRNYEHPHWSQVAERCLTCGNCTMVCPTCFCTSIEDTTDLSDTQAERWRKWDSCFTIDFTYLHGGKIRYSPRSRYRQWLTHKLATWQDQFGSFGCVGCGRCISWCPVGIDLTAEVKVLKENDMAIRSGDLNV
ncbi:MAG TPA: 4Fe-4S dicluster domain-containing protein [Chloroflexia bacterium]|nr:4Fe-4S dicluster domain-containing protein [Chloroflexia bacterium]